MIIMRNGETARRRTGDKAASCRRTPKRAVRAKRFKRFTERSAAMKHKLFRGLGAILFKEFIVVARDPLTLFFFSFSAAHRDGGVRIRAG